MKHAVFLPNFGVFGDPRLMATLAKEAEAAGWDGFFIWDHINRPIKTPIIDPWITLAAIAINTERIQFGAMITPIPRRRPWKLARETATLSNLSDGRLIFGAGLGSTGGREVEWGAFHEEMNLKARGDMLDEGLQILKGLWSGEPYHFKGQHYQVEEVQFLPPPPHIPIWVGGDWDNKKPFRRAAQWDGVFPNFRQSEPDYLTQFKAMVAYVMAHRTSDAHFDIVHNSAPHLENRAEQMAAFEAAGATWWLERLNPPEFGIAWEDTETVEPMREYIGQGVSFQTRGY